MPRVSVCDVAFEADVGLSDPGVLMAATKIGRTLAGTAVATVVAGLLPRRIRKWKQVDDWILTTTGPVDAIR